MLSFLYVYSDHSILEYYNLFSGVELSMRSFFVIFDGETSSKSMLLLMRRHLVFSFFFLLVLPTWLYSYKDYSCRGNLDDSHF